MFSSDSNPGDCCQPSLCDLVGLAGLKVYVTFSQGLWQRMQVTSNKSFRHVFAFHSFLPKGQTHREVGAQSHGSACCYVDRQTAEVNRTSAVFRCSLPGRRSISRKSFNLSLSSVKIQLKSKEKNR